MLYLDLAHDQARAKGRLGSLTDLREAMGVEPDSKCVTECVRRGSQYALYDGKNVYVLGDQKSPEKFAARKVTITGEYFEKTKILRADAIAAAR